MQKLIGFFKLRDPLWQAIGALIGALALVISTIVAYDIYRRSSPIDLTDLKVWKRYGYAPVWISDPLMENRVKFTLDGEELKFLFTYNYIIENTGQSAILPDDFLEPLQVSIGDSWELLLVETGYANPPELKVKWTRVNTNTYQLEPLLLNASDNIEVLIYLTHDTKKEDAPEPVWSGRIVNVQSFMETEPEAARSLVRPGPIHFEYSSRGFLLLIALFQLFFMGTMLLRKRYRRMSDLSSLFFIALNAFFSLSTSNTIIRAIIEISIAIYDVNAVDLFFRWGIIPGFTHAYGWMGYWLLLGAHLLFLILVCWPSIEQNIRRVQNSRESQ